jgi:hypothetical protein
MVRLIVAARMWLPEGVIRLARAVIEALRLAFARDTLGHESPAAAEAPVRKGVLHVLLVSREPLGTESAPPPRAGRPLLRWIFGREALPLDPAPPRPARRSRLAALFAPEKLDDSP